MWKYFYVASFSGALYYNDANPQKGFVRAWSAAGALKKARAKFPRATVVEIYHSADAYHRNRNILIRG